MLVTGNLKPELGCLVSGLLSDGFFRLVRGGFDLRVMAVGVVRDALQAVLETLQETFA